MTHSKKKEEREWLVFIFTMYLNVEVNPKLILPESGVNSELRARLRPGSNTSFMVKDSSKTRSLVYRIFRSWP